MAYDETLALRIRAELQTHAAIAERKMFGGLAFMISGNMCCCVTETRLAHKSPSPSQTRLDDTSCLSLIATDCASCPTSSPGYSLCRRHFRTNPFLRRGHQLPHRVVDLDAFCRQTRVNSGMHASDSWGRASHLSKGASQVGSGVWNASFHGIFLHLGSWLLSVVMVPTHSSMNTNHGRQLAATESSVIVADHNYAASRSWDPA